MFELVVASLCLVLPLWLFIRAILLCAVVGACGSSMVLRYCLIGWMEAYFSRMRNIQLHRIQLMLVHRQRREVVKVYLGFWYQAYRSELLRNFHPTVDLHLNQGLVDKLCQSNGFSSGFVYSYMVLSVSRRLCSRQMVVQTCSVGLLTDGGGDMFP